MDMEASSASNVDFSMENGNVEILFVETVEKDGASAETLSLPAKKPIKTRSIVYQFNWVEETSEWACIICSYVRFSISAETFFKIFDPCFIGKSILLLSLEVLDH